MNTSITSVKEFVKPNKIVIDRFIRKEKGNLPMEFGKIRPLKLIHSPTMTP